MLLHYWELMKQREICYVPIYSSKDHCCLTYPDWSYSILWSYMDMNTFSFSRSVNIFAKILRYPSAKTALILRCRYHCCPFHIFHRQFNLEHFWHIYFCKYVIYWFTASLIYAPMSFRIWKVVCTNQSEYFSSSNSITANKVNHMQNTFRMFW